MIHNINQEWQSLATAWGVALNQDTNTHTITIFDELFNHATVEDTYFEYMAAQLEVAARRRLHFSFSAERLCHHIFCRFGGILSEVDPVLWAQGSAAARLHHKVWVGHTHHGWHVVPRGQRFLAVFHYLYRVMSMLSPLGFLQAFLRSNWCLLAGNGICRHAPGKRISFLWTTCAEKWVVTHVSFQRSNQRRSERAYATAQPVCFGSRQNKGY